MMIKPRIHRLNRRTGFSAGLDSSLPGGKPPSNFLSCIYQFNVYHHQRLTLLLMDTNSEYCLQINAAGEDSQTSGTQATIDWNMDGDVMPQAPLNAGDAHFNMSTGQTSSLSTIQPGLHSEDPSQSSASLAVRLDEFVTSPVFSSYRLYCNQQPDAIVYSSDGKCFFIHTSLLLSVSCNKFGGLIQNSNSSASYDNPLTLSMAISSDVLDIILRVIYLIEFPPTLPTFSTLESAVCFLEHYGITPLSEWIRPASHMFNALASLAPEHALELYALAAEFDIEPLAAHVSSFLLELSLSSISEKMAERIGGVYMKRLGNLQIGRINALKEILLPGPPSHPIQGNECSEERQIALTRSYALAATYVCWDDRADLPASYIEETFRTLYNKTECPSCKDGLDRRVKESIEAWTNVKRTI